MATKRGYPTFNLDRVGNGASDHPVSTLVDVDANEFVVHQVVQALRAGEVASQSFEKVMVVGHSLGSMATIEYAGTYPGEADGIILTGVLHDINWAWATENFVTKFWPAALDVKFYGQFGEDYGYLMTLPGTGAGAFYYLPNTDPEVVALDESLKQTTTAAEFSTGPKMLADPGYIPMSWQIEGLVQVVIGQYDYLFCGNTVNCDDKAAVQTYEEAKFGDSACVETDVISDAAHVINLHVNADAAYRRMPAWADRHVGRTAGPAPEPGTPGRR